MKARYSWTQVWTGEKRRQAFCTAPCSFFRTTCDTAAPGILVYEIISIWNDAFYPYSHLIIEGFLGRYIAGIRQRADLIGLFYQGSSRIESRWQPGSKRAYIEGHTYQVCKGGRIHTRSLLFSTSSIKMKEPKNEETNENQSESSAINALPS